MDIGNAMEPVATQLVVDKEATMIPALAAYKSQKIYDNPIENDGDRK